MGLNISGAGSQTPITLVLAILLVFLAVPVQGSNLPCCPIGDPAIGTTTLHRVTIVQGDDPAITVVEPKERIVVTDRSFWSIPWNNSEVYTYVPPEAVDISTEHVEEVESDGKITFIPGRFSTSRNPGNPSRTGLVEEGDYSGFRYWSFPEGTSRELTTTLGWDTPAEFKDFDPELTVGDDWDTSGGTLILLPGVESSTFVSKHRALGHDLTSLTMTADGVAIDGLRFQASSDNGTSWTDLESGTTIDLPGTGNLFRWRVTFDRNAQDLSDTILDWVSFNISYIPDFNNVWLETVYTLEPSGSSTGFDMSLPFDGDCTALALYAYFDSDVELRLEGAEMECLEDTPDPGRTTHRVLSDNYSSLIRFELGDEGSQGGGREVPGAGSFAAIAMLSMVSISRFLSRKGTWRSKGGARRSIS
jgi:hypothetical protein